MEFLNIGIPELIIIVLLMLILLGPEGMIKTARTLAQTVRKIIRSPLWNDMMKVQNEIRDIPTRLVRDAGIDEPEAEINKALNEAAREIRSVYQPNSTGGPYNLLTDDLYTKETGNGVEPAGPAPESFSETPAEDLPVDASGEDQP